MADADNTAPKQVIGKPFQPGQSGNPNGRPKGSRNKLGEAFIEALHDDFAENGKDVISKVRTDDPATYMRVVAGLLPKEFKIEHVDDLTDEQLDSRIRSIAGALGIEIGVGVASGGEAKTEKPKPARNVQAVH